MNRKSTASLSAHQRLEAVTDLADLNPVSDDIILSCLRERFNSDNIYTNIGSHVLVSLNPNKYVASSSDQTLNNYAAEYRRTTTETEGRLPPHIFQIACDAYYHMRRTSRDQSILFSGESGSGKSENRRLAIKSLLELSVPSPGKKGSKLALQIPASEFVLETFGNARTLANPNASRFGKYTELQFSERGRLCGIKTLDYYLEKNRVASVPAGERNFHIFHYLLAGASPDESRHLHLIDKMSFRYLGHRSSRADTEDDGPKFNKLKMALKDIGLSKRNVAQTCQLVAAILHLGNLDFTIDRSRNEDAAIVRNVDSLDIVAEFLGVSADALESTLSYRTKLVKKELCTVFLDPEGASENRDELAKTLYSLLFGWLNEHVNQRLCRDDFGTFIGLFDLPGPQNNSGTNLNSLDQFLVNFANERLTNWTQRRLFEAHVGEYTSEGVGGYVPRVPYFDNAECVRLLRHRPGGLIHIMDDQARRAPKKTAQTMTEAFAKRWATHGSFKLGGTDRTGSPSFVISHWNGPVTYSSEGLLDRNVDGLNPDFVSLLRGAGEGAGDGGGSNNPFVRGLFLGKAIATQAHPRDEDTIVSAQQPVRPMRAPSTRRNRGTLKRITETEAEADKDEYEDAGGKEHQRKEGGIPCVAGEFREALDTLFDTLDETQSWHAISISPNSSQLPAQLEGRTVKAQIKSSGLSEIARRSRHVFEVGMTLGEFCERYGPVLESKGVVEGDEGERVMQARTAFGLAEGDVVKGLKKVYLSHVGFHRFEDALREREGGEDQKRNRAELEGGSRGDIYAPYASPRLEIEVGENSPWGVGDAYNASNQALPLVAHASPFQRADLYDEDYEERKSLRSEEYDARSRFTSLKDDSVSNFGTESYAPSRNMFQGGDKKALIGKEDQTQLAGEIQEGETVEVMKETSARRRWVAICWLLTFWVPSPFLTWFGRMKRPDVKQAWREKLALNLIIWLMCAATVFVIAVLGVVICPTEHVYSMEELKSHSFANSPNNVYTAVRGEVFDLTTVAATHQRIVGVVPEKSILKYGGVIADDLFPVQVSALCNGISGSVSPYVTLDSGNVTDENAVYHDFRVFSNDSRPDWYFESMVQMRYTARMGFMGYTPKELRKLADNGRSVAVYNGLVYDVSNYIKNGPGVGSPSGQQAPVVDTQFMSGEILDLFKFNAGQDITKRLNGLNIDPDLKARQKVCLRNLFTIGKVDNRQSPQCLFATYILLVLSIIMVSVIGFKFLASVNFGAARAPEDHDKFVICQVPCYTEGDASLRKTIDSLAQLKYDDKRKLILIVCDGNIVGSGNDRTTPRIVLDILGSDPNLDPEPLSFLSLGEGAKQHNMGKVYSGLYECAGHVVPYLVIVKLGKPTERTRPGNRGKRDSQMVVMHFLNKVHFNSPMNPLELEVYHQIKNVIGVNPTFYEYLFTVDADTTVDPFSVNRLISAMIHDKKLLGVCGETQLANAKQSIITMMQVYEYFISHHMAKAFESLFGSVTCLPGCFTLYRLRTPDTHKPLLISNQVIQDYSENRVDTLHMKNLLHLGEDRYLTTLLLKHFPLFKTQFVRDAHAYTVAPDDWKVLLSQRRRWINSTVHNLGELMFLEQLCGFCCFSMRFVVMIDLVSTLTQPVTVAYIAYLIYLVAGEHKAIPQLALIMIAAIYGLQAFVFIIRRKWDMIGWMVFYILAIPAFSFFLPLYSFWRMDDFSWGQTRIVMGESGKKVVVHDEGKFDPKSIPLKSWNDYENELWDKESNHSIGSWVPPVKGKNDGYAESQTASLYGRETYYEPQRSYSPAPVYQSGRNTPQSHLRPMSDVGGLHGGSYGSQGGQRPMTSYLDMPVPQTRTPDNDFGEFGMTNRSGRGSPAQGGGPSDGDLERAIDDILRASDLNSVTKREIRRQLEDMFGLDLTSRKAGINAAIDRLLMAHA